MYWQCVTSGEPLPKLVSPLAMFARKRLLRSDLEPLVVTAPRRDGDYADAHNSLWDAMVQRKRDDGRPIIGIDARAKRGEVIVSSRRGTDYYCVDVFVNGDIVLDLYQQTALD